MKVIPNARCVQCQEAVFTHKKGVVLCQQCRIAKNAGRKYQRLTSKCNWRGGYPTLPAADRKRPKGGKKR